MRNSPVATTVTLIIASLMAVIDAAASQRTEHPSSLRARVVTATSGLASGTKATAGSRLGNSHGDIRFAARGDKEKTRATEKDEGTQGRPVVLRLTQADNAVEESKIAFNIPAQPLNQSLNTFAQQAALRIVFDTADAEGLAAPALNATLTADQALKKLLGPTGLKAEYLDNKTVAIRKETRTTSLAPAAGPLRLAQSEEQGADTEPSGGSSQKTSSEASKDRDSGTLDSSIKEIDMRAIPEILIQGSRILNVDVKRTEDDPQPYYIFDSAAIEQSGATSVEEFLKQRLTMNTSFQSQSQQYVGRGFGAPSSSAINLRGLGANETLILIDGRRSAAVSFFGNSSQPDINGIPTAAIERIEVLPSSASAIYGGAAVGGVVNIILKKSFQGGDVRLKYDDTFGAHAPLRTVNATYGLSLEGGKTQLMLSGQYADGDPLLTQDRLNLVQRGISTILRNSPSFFYSPSFPFNGATPNIAGIDENFSPTNLFLRDGTPLNSSITSIPFGAGPDSNTSEALIENAGRYNLGLANGGGQFGLQNPIGVVPTVKSAVVTARRGFGAVFEGFTGFSTSSNATHTSINPFDSNFSVVPASAPGNPFRQDVIVNFPTALSTPFATDSVTKSATFGLVARLPKDWSSELDFTWSKNSSEYAYNTADGTAASEALASGAINPFVDTIAFPLGLSSYLGDTSGESHSTLNDLGLRASGPLGVLPWGSPVLTIGLEHRKEGFDTSHALTAYPISQTDNLDIEYFGQSQSTNSAYAEALVPLVTSINAVPLVRALDLQVAARAERYTVYAGTAFAYITPVGAQIFNPPQGVHTKIEYTSTNPTIALKYKPVEEVTLRVSYAKAFLPPSAAQLLRNPQPACGFPCRPIVDPLNGESYNIDISQGGNPSLKPQTARNWDFGVIWEPQTELLRGLRLDLENYNITQPNYITIPTVQEIVSNPAFGSRITRDATTGRITLVDDSFLNATKYKTNGWDLTVDYSRPSAMGTFALHALGTLIEHDQRQYTIGGSFLEYAAFPTDGGETKIKANATVSWDYQHWTLAWTTIYYGSYFQANAPGSPSAEQGNSFLFYLEGQGSNSIPSQLYHDLFGSYSFGKKGADSGSGLRGALFSDLTLSFGIKNLFNTLPPFDAAVGPYYYSPYGDPRLRAYRISLQKNF